MATVDELKILIKADTKDLKRKLDKTNKQLEKTNKSSKKAGASMGAAFAKGAVAVAALTAVTIKLGSTIAKVGMQFEDLKDSLNQVFGSMEAGDVAMQKVFKFAQTTPFQIEDATKAFIALKSAGIEPNMQMLQTFADTASVSVDQLGTFEALIRMVQRSASGGMGLEELNMIADRGIDVLGILSEKLNLGKDDIATYGKTADGAAKMVKALTDGLQEKFGGAMEDKMDNLSTKTSNMQIALKQLADDVFQSGLGEWLKDITDALAGLAIGILNARRAARGEIVRTPEEETAFVALTPQLQMEQLEAERDAANKRVLQLAEEIEQTEILAKTDVTGTTGDRLVILEARLKKFQALSFNLEKERLRIRNATQKATKEEIILTDEQIALQNEFNKLYQATIPEYDKLQTKIETLSEALENNTKDAKGNPLFDPEKGQAVLEHLKKLQEELDETAGFTKAMEDVITSSAHSFTTDFVNSLLEGESALESFKNFARNIVSQIIAIFLQMAVVNQILNAVFGLTGSNALPTLNMGGFKTKPGMGVDASLNYGMQAAGGGSLQKGIPALVGERGPEIFVPNTGGKIMNNMNSKNAMGGGAVVVNQSINFATGVVPTVRAEVTKMLPQISDVTKGAVLEAAVRGGSYRKGLMGRG